MNAGIITNFIYISLIKTHKNYTYNCMLKIFNTALFKPSNTTFKKYWIEGAAQGQSVCLASARPQCQTLGSIPRITHKKIFLCETNIDTENHTEHICT
jgi:hypothetical protein